MRVLRGSTVREAYEFTKNSLEFSEQCIASLIKAIQNKKYVVSKNFITVTPMWTPEAVRIYKHVLRSGRNTIGLPKVVFEFPPHIGGNNLIAFYHPYRNLLWVCVQENVPPLDRDCFIEGLSSNHFYMGLLKHEATHYLDALRWTDREKKHKALSTKVRQIHSDNIENSLGNSLEYLRYYFNTEQEVQAYFSDVIRRLASMYTSQKQKLTMSIVVNTFEKEEFWLYLTDSQKRRILKAAYVFFNKLWGLFESPKKKGRPYVR